MKEEIGLKQVVEGLRGIVAENPDKEAACQWLKSEANPEPECLIAVLLMDRLKVLEPGDIVEGDSWRFKKENPDSTRPVLGWSQSVDSCEDAVQKLSVKRLGREVSFDAIRFMQMVQDKQDYGYTWKQALESAEDAMEAKLEAAGVPILERS